MKVEAVQCDASGCESISVPAEGSDLPYDWLAVEIYQEGAGQMEPRVFCSWNCLREYSELALPVKAKIRRKRRTKAEIEADAAREAEELDRSLGVPPQ